MSAMEASLINPFLTATMDIFGKMFDLDAKSGNPYILARQLYHPWEISGFLGVTGDYIGIVVIRLHRSLADKMLLRSGIKTESETERVETVYGMVGELANIIAGNAATAIAHVSIEVTPPAVIMGKNHVIAWPETIPVIGIPFSSPGGPFEVDVCFRKRNRKN